MSGLLASNRDALAARFPEVLVWLEGAAAPGPVEETATPRQSLSVGGLRLASGYDPEGEAEHQAALVPPGVPRVACYGLGTGALPRVLLERPGLERLDVRLFHPGVAAAVFARFDCGDWLADERVDLGRASADDEIHPSFAAAPACLRLAEDAALRLRDMVFLELATLYLTEHVSRRAGDLAQRYAENRARVAADGDVGELFTAKVERAWVAGAGPTLADSFARLRERPAGEPVIAVDAALAPLLAAGVVPDVVLTMDAHREHQLALFDIDLGGLNATPLVYAPQVHGDVLARWPGPRLAFFEPARRAETAALGVTRTELWCSGSVIHPAVDLAARLGAREVRLCGLDFAHVGGRSHVAGMAHARDDAQADVRAGAVVVDGGGKRVPTLPNLVGYLRDLERYLACRPGVRFVNQSRAGARITGTVYAEEVE